MASKDKMCMEHGMLSALYTACLSGLVNLDVHPGRAHVRALLAAHCAHNRQPIPIRHEQFDVFHPAIYPLPVPNHSVSPNKRQLRAVGSI